MCQHHRMGATGALTPIVADTNRSYTLSALLTIAAAPVVSMVLATSSSNKDEPL